MSTIRRQSIISSFVVYIGLALGFFNTYMLTRQGGFSREEYGLIGIFIAVAQLMFSLSNVGMPAFLTKFFPYYKAHLPERKNDQLTIALLLPCAGFLILLILGLLFKDVVGNKIFSNAPELLRYYYWLFPFGFGFTIFLVMEAYSWQRGKAVISNFLKEVGFRAFVSLLLVFSTIGFIKNFNTFIGLYSFIYLALVFYFFFYFWQRAQLNFTFKKSNVTKKFRKKIISLIGFVWGGGLVFSIASVVDTLIIAAVLPNGVGAAAVFTFGQYIASLIQAPQRAVVSASVGPLSQAWKDKDYKKLKKIYHRSSINQLVFSCAMFSLIWINFEDGVFTFHLQKEYIDAKWIFFYIGLTKVLDMGTGVNAQIISTSSYWKYEFKTGMILLAITLPLNYFLAVKYGITGPAIANLFSFTVYNAIRYFFLLRKFDMQPFDKKTLLALLLSGGCFLLAYLPLKNNIGLHWMVIRSLLFCVPFAMGVVWMKLSPDAIPVWLTVKKKLRLG
ncbi:MAG TPA: polysaccharide biosynthesis C-terminal domain-containing protein [Flavisolibacter sp.]|nr:polysaccharide biosynthesis C-terminal domain-containing protein [Flavisolibacter sp.]